MWYINNVMVDYQLKKLASSSTVGDYFTSLDYLETSNPAPKQA